MLVFFILLTIVVQVGFLVVARNAASVAVQGAIRSAAFDEADIATAQERLERDLAATVPLGGQPDVSITTDGEMIHGTAAFDWVPPGPDLIHVRIVVSRSTPVVVPP